MIPGLICTCSVRGKCTRCRADQHGHCTNGSCKGGCQCAICIGSKKWYSNEEYAKIQNSKKPLTKSQKKNGWQICPQCKGKKNESFKPTTANGYVCSECYSKCCFTPKMMITNQVTINDIREAIKYMELDPLGDIKEIDWNFPRDEDDDDD